jgi:hypothetical protein
MAVSLYWFGGGPGVDPSYTPTGYTDTDAYNWGVKQADQAVSDWAFLYEEGYVLNPYIYLDMEQINGWNEWATTNGETTNSCAMTYDDSGCCNAILDGEVYDGFDATVRTDEFEGGVYASNYFWNTETFGCGACSSGDGHLSTTYEWTYGGYPTGNPGLYPVPTSDWCMESDGTCTEQAQFFAGENKSTSSYTVMWQWTGGGYSGGLGDYDQLDLGLLGYS